MHRVHGEPGFAQVTRRGAGRPPGFPCKQAVLAALLPVALTLARVAGSALLGLQLERHFQMAGDHRAGLLQPGLRRASRLRTSRSGRSRASSWLWCGDLPRPWHTDRRSSRRVCGSPLPALTGTPMLVIVGPAVSAAGSRGGRRSAGGRRRCRCGLGGRGAVLPPSLPEVPSDRAVSRAARRTTRVVATVLPPILSRFPRSRPCTAGGARSITPLLGGRTCIPSKPFWWC